MLFNIKKSGHSLIEENTLSNLRVSNHKCKL